MEPDPVVSANIEDPTTENVEKVCKKLAKIMIKEEEPHLKSIKTPGLFASNSIMSTIQQPIALNQNSSFNPAMAISPAMNPSLLKQMSTTSLLPKVEGTPTGLMFPNPGFPA